MDFFEDKIVVWDQYSQKLLYYGLDTKFLGEHNIERYSQTFHQFGDNCIMFNSVNDDNVRAIKDYTLFTCDTLSNLVSVGMYRKKNSYHSIWNNHNFFAVDSLVYYHPVYCDSIYSISSDNTIKPEYYIEFGDFTAPEKYRDNSIKDSEFQLAQSSGKYSFFDGDFYLTDNYLLFNYCKANHLYRGLYSKISNKLVCFSSTNCDRIFPLVFPLIRTSTSDAFVGFFFPAFCTPRTSKIPLSERETLEKKYGKERTDLIYSMKNDDNAIITFFYPSI